MLAVRRHQVEPSLGGEVPGDDDTVTVLPGQDQIGTQLGKCPRNKSSASVISISSACERRHRHDQRTITPGTSPAEVA